MSGYNAFTKKEAIEMFSASYEDATCSTKCLHCKETSFHIGIWGDLDIPSVWVCPYCGKETTNLDHVKKREKNLIAKLKTEISLLVDKVFLI